MPTDPSDLEKLRLHASLLAAYGDVRNTPTEAELWAGCKDAAQMLLEAADELARLRADFLRYAIHGTHAAIGQHNWGCEKDNQPINGKCECGLDAARARIKGSS